MLTLHAGGCGFGPQHHISQAWWHTPVFPVGEQGAQGHLQLLNKFEASLGYLGVCLNT